MKKYEGIHFYINIKNFNDIILDEEEKTGSVNHSIHALDTFFSSIEWFSIKNYKETLVIEKITGSRLHIYVTDSIKPAFDAVKIISAFANKLAKIINKDIGKYKKLLDFKIQVGVAYGNFYDFEFKTEVFSEMTTIGYACNYAAKLQSLAKSEKINISEDIYIVLSSQDKLSFLKEEDSSIEKYGQSCYYSSLLSSLNPSFDITADDMRFVIEYANKVNLSEMEYTGVQKPINFNHLSVKDCKRINGIPVYADIRDFTSKFDPKDNNLEEMTKKTQDALFKMYDVTNRYGGIHIQFQGDRELSLYHDITGSEPTNCFKPAVLASMRMIDALKPLTLLIGIGQDYGRLFATRIGARSNKDNILLGETVLKADYMEDKCAGENQIAITKEVYDGIKNDDPILVKYFEHIDSDIYIAKIGYQDYLNSIEKDRLHNDTKSNKYNGAWGD